ncbi:TonB-dependent receptor [Luteimonas sp. Y-2-2-4F]|nr:TonB-dependent receptor [Luteimonas sp. Y-2-2-4F]MCD9032981.1 TonB-dependent receptor [Luteimonas sp. Y-2-2-4F]
MSPARPSPASTLLAAAILSALAGAARADDDADRPAAPTKATTLDSVQVTAARHPPLDGGALGSRPLLSTPFSLVSINAADLVERQANSIGSAFALDAAVKPLGNTYTIHNTRVAIRGLPLDETNGYKVNGLATYNFGAELPLEAFEQIDLLKGLSGFLYGFGAPGGTINYVTKKPTDARLLSATLGIHSDSLLSQHVDLGGRAGAGERFGYRVNLAHEDGELYNGGELERTAASASFDARLTDRLTWTADAIYQDRTTRDTVQGFSTAYYTGDALPPLFDPERRLQASDGAILESRYRLLGTGLRWDLAPDWKASFDVGHSENTRRFVADWFYPTDADWNYDVWMNDSRSFGQFDHGQALVQGRFETGAVRHEIVAGGAWQRETRDFNATQVWTRIGSSNLYAPTDLGYVSTMVPQMYRGAEYTQSALFLSDTLSFGEQWSVLAGARYTRYRQVSFNPAGQATSRYEKSPLTPTVALIWTPTARTTLYASYVESLEQGAVVGSTYANANAVLDPLESEQYELGLKVDGGHWQGTVAAFDTRRGAAYANADNVYVQDGTVRYRGLDASARWNIGSQWSLDGSATWLERAEYERAAAAVEGHRAEGAPRWQAALQLAYRTRTLPDLRWYAGARYAGAVAIDAANRFELPAYTTFVLGGAWRTEVGDRPLTVRAAIENLADRRYVQYVQSTFFFPGSPRTFALSAQLDF